MVELCPSPTAGERGGNNLNGVGDLRSGNGSSQGQKSASTGVCVPSSLDKGLDFHSKYFQRSPAQKSFNRSSVLHVSTSKTYTKPVGFKRFNLPICLCHVLFQTPTSPLLAEHNSGFRVCGLGFESGSRVFLPLVSIHEPEPEKEELQKHVPSSTPKSPSRAPPAPMLPALPALLSPAAAPNEWPGGAFVECTGFGGVECGGGGCDTASLE